MSEKGSRVLILHSSAPGAEGSPPLGAGCVAAALAAAGAAAAEDILLLDAGAEPRDEALLALIGDYSPDLIGFSCYVWNSPRFAGLAAPIRERLPLALIAAGGPDAEGISLDPAKAGPFDALFLGEAEISFPSWAARRLAAGRPHGPAAGRLRVRAPGEGGPEILRGPLPDPGDLTSPWLAGRLEPRPGSRLAWELVRGCPYSCAYCYEGRGEPGLRLLPRARIEAELELFKAAGAEEVFVLDPTFNARRERALDLLSLLAERGGDIRWNFEIRAELLDRAQARAFSRLACSLQIGLQSSRPEVLAQVGRGIDRRKFAAAARILDEEGVVYGFDLIYGLPGDDLAGFEESLDFALSLSPNHLDIFPLAVLPGTRLAAGKSELGLVSQTEPPYLLESSPSFPAKDLRKAAALAEAASLFYSRGRAVPWFAAVLSPLRMRASAFLGGLEPGRAGLELDHREIEAVQIAHLERLYRARGLERLLPGVLDLVRYHGAWSRAFAEGERSVLELSHPLELVGSPAMLDLRSAAGFRLSAPRRVEVGPGRGGPKAKELRT